MKSPSTSGASTRRRPLGALRARHGEVRVLELGQDLLAPLVIGGAVVREADAPRGPVQEPHAEPLLEARDDAAHARGRQAELLAGAREAARVDDALEDADLAEHVHRAITSPIVDAASKEP
nr:hypothetical protein [Sorangium cellulosum]